MTTYLWVIAVFLLVTVITAFLRYEQSYDKLPSVRATLYLMFIAKLMLLIWTVVLIVTWRAPIERLVLL